MKILAIIKTQVTLLIIIEANIQILISVLLQKMDEQEKRSDEQEIQEKEKNAIKPEIKEPPVNHIFQLETVSAPVPPKLKSILKKPSVDISLDPLAPPPIKKRLTIDLSAIKVIIVIKFIQLLIEIYMLFMVDLWDKKSE